MPHTRTAGLVFHPPVRSRTPAQQAKDTHVARIAKKWPIPHTRGTSASRGLERRGNTCYRLSTLQVLMHLPKFLNWILSHNVADATGNTVNGCSPATFATGFGCAACHIKALVQSYWGEGNVVGGVPAQILHNDSVMRDINHMTNVMMGVPPGGPIPQEDAELFYTQLLHELDDSVNTLIPGITPWSDQYAALFTIQRSTTRLCNTCNTPRTIPITVPSIIARQDIGFISIPINQHDHDSVSAAIHRHMQPSALGLLQCTTCNANQQFTDHHAIIAAPEYLRIKLNIVYHDAAGNVHKITNPIALDKTLDLTQYQTDRSTPLKYKLISVIQHSGQGLQSGHYAATVKGRAGVAVVDDGVVRDVAERRLRDNPMVWGGAGKGMRFQAVVLMYVRTRNRELL
ncbi:cysteine proteinase [Lojkania enalia]|uniref:Cysteine proteinase n=1 Tax=Lojkania enalia TaxID=147567 RepID=A0A9P4MYT3_9PLEO|nr:cysteine proteinase [Didymosphaeria enalia]